MGCLANFFDATNGILQGCPLSVILINLLTSIWKRVLDAQQQGIKVAVQGLPPSDQPVQPLGMRMIPMGLQPEATHSPPYLTAPLTGLRTRVKG